MIRWLIRLALNGTVLLAVSAIIPAVRVRDFGVALLAAFLLGIVNTIIRPVLVWFTLPLNLLTLGLFWFVVNAATFSLTAYLIDGFELGPWPGSIWTTILAAALMSFFGWVIYGLVGKKKKAS